MELVFHENRLEYLSRILCETITQEQTAELIVPDSYPDAQRIVDAYGTAVIRSEECSAGSVAMSGQVQAGVVFVAENGEIHTMQTQIPFAVRKEFDSRREECFLQCSCTVRSVDARVLNSRKLLVRVGVICTMLVYARDGCTTYDMPDASPNLQLKRTTLPLQMPLGLGEKSFVLNEELELPAGKPAIDRLLKCAFRTQVLEQKLVGSKAVFKGNLLVHSLYEAVDGRIQSFEADLPFSQYVDMDGEFDDRQLQTTLSMTSADAEPDGQMECRRLLLSVNLLAQCTACGEQKLTLVEDAYCTDAEFTPRWNEWDMCAVLDCQNFRETAIVSQEVPAASIVDVWVTPDEPVRRWQDGEVRMELPLLCDVLYYDDEGQLQGKRLHTSVTVETGLAENGQCRICNVDIGEVFCTANGNGIEVRCSVGAEIESYAAHHLRGVAGGITEELPSQGDRPSVILRHVDTESDVWEIAKASRTAMEAVMEANGLQSTVVAPGTMLLIPM